MPHTRTGNLRTGRAYKLRDWVASVVQMGDSDDDHLAERPAKRQKRFTFQRFSQRVAQVCPTPAVTSGLLPCTDARDNNFSVLVQYRITISLNGPSDSTKWSLCRWMLTYTVGLAMSATSPCLDLAPSSGSAKWSLQRLPPCSGATVP